MRKSRLERSLPPSPPSTVWRESIVPDLDMDFLRPRPAPPVPSIKRKLLATSKAAPAAPLPVPPPAGPPSYEQAYMYSELARIHEKQSRVLKSYADNLARQLPREQQQQYQYQETQAQQQQSGSLGWKKTVKKVIMKDW